MIGCGKKIAYHRKRLNMTQTELGDKLSVTAQAVSKWEKDISEPDLSTLQAMAAIFGIGVEEFFKADEPADVPAENEDDASAEEETVDAESASAEVVPAEVVQQNEQPPVAAVVTAPKEKVVTRIIIGYCSECKKPIEQRDEYNVKNTRGGQQIYCHDCFVKQECARLRNNCAEERKNLRRGIGWGITAAVIISAIGVWVAISGKDYVWFSSLGVALLAFTFISQCFWDSPVMDVLAFFCRSFRMPAVIFTLDIGGIIFLITVKIWLAILAGTLSVLCFLLGVAIAFPMSLFTFPFYLSRQRSSISDMERQLKRYENESETSGDLSGGAAE